MPEEILRLDEVERIARDFIMKKWNGEVAEFRGNWPCPSEGVHEIEGMAKIPQRVATGEPKHLPDNAPFYETAVVNVECLFKLRVSVKDREVIGYRVEQPKPPSPNSQPEPPSPNSWPEPSIVCPNDPSSLARMYGIDPSSFRKH